MKVAFMCGDSYVAIDNRYGMMDRNQTVRDEIKDEDEIWHTTSINIVISKTSANTKKTSLRNIEVIISHNCCWMHK